jgi:Predicted esterase of the alpha-beta hydrolase superfamily
MDTQSAPRTAFVLAGGGSYGAVQVGMLKQLVAYGIKPDIIVGASVGAINGAYFAGDPSASGVARLEQIWRGLRRHDVFPVSLKGLVGIVSRRNYLVEPVGLRGLLERHLPYERLEEAAIPFTAVATDLLAGSTVNLSSGPVVEAVLASAAIPAAFPYVELDGRYLADGGISDNTPIATAIALGATRLIMLPTGFACLLAEPPRGAIAIALHALNLLIARQLVIDMERFLNVIDLIVVPPLCPLSVSPYDFSRTGELIDRAAETTKRWLEKYGLQEGRIPQRLRPHEH